jgi:hypothetical protein
MLNRKVMQLAPRLISCISEGVRRIGQFLVDIGIMVLIV